MAMRIKVLLVEDDHALREALADTLLLAGHGFRAVASAEEALQAVAGESFSLVVSDVNMPGMDGHQLLGRLRASQPQLPVLLMTAHGAVERAVDAMRQGAVDYLVKPFEPKALLDAFVDLMITFFMFAVTVVMLAGGGALLEQQFAIPAILGSVIVTLIVVAVVCLDVHKVIGMIGAATPFLILTAVAVALYGVASRDLSFSQLDQLASQQPAGASHWLLGALLYVSYNIVAGVPILAIMGGAAKSEKQAIRGGIIGGAILGLLMLIMSLGLLSRLDSVADLPMPMLSIATEVSPALGLLMAVIIFCMILNTAVGTLYSFSARLLPAGTRKFRIGSVAAGVLAFIGSLVGFISLVGQVYPLFGYLGFVLIAAVLIAWLRAKSTAGLSPQAQEEFDQ